MTGEIIILNLTLLQEKKRGNTTAFHHLYVVAYYTYMAVCNTDKLFIRIFEVRIPYALGYSKMQEEFARRTLILTPKKTVENR